MNAAAQSFSSYKQNAETVKTPRDVEYEMLARVTGKIKACLSQSMGKISPSLAKALHENQRLWVAFAVDLAHVDNALPKELRARLFYLSEFVLNFTPQVLDGKASAEQLVEINTIVMRGLRGRKDS